MTEKRKQIDWEKIEADFRAGAKTLREISEGHDISHVAISKRAKRYGWTRDLSKKIKARAREKVNKASVNSAGLTAATMENVLEVESEVQSRITLSHRKDIPQKSALVSKLFAEIEGMTEGAQLFETVREALGSGDMEALAKAVHKVTTLPQRIKGTTDLVNAYKTLIGLERQAFGIDDSSTPDSDGGYIIVPAKRVAHE